MIIKRVYNNNVALVDDAGTEKVAIGRGLCFGKRPGDAVDNAQVERVFAPENRDRTAFDVLIEQIPSEYLVIAEDVRAMLREKSESPVDDGILIALADHISLSLEREKNGTPLPNPLLFETRRLYPKEFALAQEAARIIHDQMGLWISEEETGFITLHIVSATMTQNSDRILQTMNLVHDVLALVQEQFGVDFDTESLAYERFFRHLQFFAQRVFDGQTDQAADQLVVLFERDAYPEAFTCVDRICAYVKAAYGTSVNDAERTYLVIHLINLLGATGQHA